ncbi:MAG: hypothetical protein IPH22_13970 [Nitrosomonas sp.]|nr:hypothetical protein [Nitrosomonas sp.]
MKLSLIFNEEVFSTCRPVAVSRLWYSWLFYQSTCFIAGVIVVAMQADHWRLRCPVCKSREIHCRGKLVRRFRTVPVVKSSLYRPSSSAGRMHPMPSSSSGKEIQFADEHKRYTRSFERLVWISLGT